MRLIQRIHPLDDAIVALRDLAAGQKLIEDGASFTLVEKVPAKQKFAARDFAADDLVTMYGVIVGRTRVPIRAGGLLTPENVEHATSHYTTKQADLVWAAPDVSRCSNRNFDGFRRADGLSGTANNWVVIPLVFCESRNLNMMREALVKALGYELGGAYQEFAGRLAAAWRAGASRAEVERLKIDNPAPDGSAFRLFPHVDGVKFLDHGLGCGGTRQDSEGLCGLLAGYINHPNVAGATVLSLGCQHTQVSLLEREIEKRNPRFQKPLHIFEQQKSASERDMIERALKATFLGIAQANDLRRAPCPVSDLTVGVKCGGSDGFSGLSANPAIGHCADLVIALGGAAVLAEFPELCGIEQSLCDRCVDTALAERFVDLMRRYERAAAACGSGFDANPSPGNIRDGLITDAMKSAGAARKGGTSPIVDVVDYPEPITKRGLTLLCTPGNDVECTTALSGSGCNLMLFSTGLGTPTGNPVCPTIKISTNSELAARMPDIIDFDAGAVIRGEKSIAETGEALLDLCIEVASGRVVPKAVQLGQDDFLPWKRGVSL
ncbi:MAG: UxaA family hydrolase [Verrucomicrobiales bacterium]